VDRLAGNVTPIRSEGQVAYRLGGDRELDDEQVAYRLGEQNDARQVFWVGDGATAREVGVTAGEAVADSDVARVQALMAGVNPVTGEVLFEAKKEVADTAKVAGVPGYDAIVMAAAERGMAAEDLFSGKVDSAAWATFARQVEAKGDTYRVPVEKLERFGRVAGVDVSGVYGADVWASAWESRKERVTVGVKGYDVGLTLPKGASIALVTAAPGEREQLADIARQCAQETYRELGERIGYGVTGHNGPGGGYTRVEGGGVVGTATMEVTSRAGDPHVHFHSLIANVTICEDGKPRTIGAGGRDVMAHGAWASERFRMKYRASTEAAGLARWGWNEMTKEYDQLGVSTEAKAVGSKRHTQIVAEKEIFGPDAGQRIDEMAERITRDAKAEKVETLADVAARFRAELEVEGVQLHGADGLSGQFGEGWDLGGWFDYLDEAMTEHKAVFTRVQLEQAISRAGAPGWCTSEGVARMADEYLAESATLAVAPTGMSQRLTNGQRYTTEAMLNAEKTVYAATADGVGRGHHTLSVDQAEMALATYEAGEGFTFNDGQRAMFMAWTTGGNQVDLTIGAAGTGKTSAADAARYAYEAHGLRVLGISTAGLAAQNLGAAAGMDVTTAHGLAHAIKMGQAPDVDVVVWDEMGMASTREQATILGWAAGNGVDVRGMGDPKQLDSVGAGSTFAKQCEQVDAVELSENMRQKHAHERDAVAQLRAGDAAGSLGVYAEHGQISVYRTQSERVEAMAAGWANDAAKATDAHQRLHTAVMLSQTRATVEQLHNAAREQARARGWITGADVTYRGPNGQRSWAVGDAVLVRRTLHTTRKDPQTAIYNGQRAIVTGIDESTRTMHVEWKDADGQLQTRTLTPDYVAANTAPGVALTNYGAQGQSITYPHVDPSASDLNAAYVQTSRTTERLHLYADLDTLDVHGKERADVMALDPHARNQWAANELATRISDKGWQAGETAHDATGTPIPEPVTVKDPARERLEALIAKSTLTAPSARVDPQSKPVAAERQGDNGETRDAGTYEDFTTRNRPPQRAGRTMGPEETAAYERVRRELAERRDKRRAEKAAKTPTKKAQEKSTAKKPPKRSRTADHDHDRQRQARDRDQGHGIGY
jgi:conjugative relaxase-like TrwC/TraI family protein